MNPHRTISYSCPEVVIGPPHTAALGREMEARTEEWRREFKGEIYGWKQPRLASQWSQEELYERISFYCWQVGAFYTEYERRNLTPHHIAHLLSLARTEDASFFIKRALHYYKGKIKEEWVWLVDCNNRRPYPTTSDLDLRVSSSSASSAYSYSHHSRGLSPKKETSEEKCAEGIANWSHRRTQFKHSPIGYQNSHWAPLSSAYRSNFYRGPSPKRQRRDENWDPIDDIRWSSSSNSRTSAWRRSREPSSTIQRRREGDPAETVNENEKEEERAIDKQISSNENHEEAADDPVEANRLVDEVSHRELDALIMEPRTTSRRPTDDPIAPDSAEMFDIVNEMDATEEALHEETVDPEKTAPIIPDNELVTVIKERLEEEREDKTTHVISDSEDDGRYWPEEVVYLEQSSSFASASDVSSDAADNSLLEAALKKQILLEQLQEQMRTTAVYTAQHTGSRIPRFLQRSLANECSASRASLRLKNSTSDESPASLSSPGSSQTPKLPGAKSQNAPTVPEIESLEDINMGEKVAAVETMEKKEQEKAKDLQGNVRPVEDERDKIGDDNNDHLELEDAVDAGEEDVVQESHLVNKEELAVVLLAESASQEDFDKHYGGRNDQSPEMLAKLRLIRDRQAEFHEENQKYGRPDIIILDWSTKPLDRKEDSLFEFVYSNKLEPSKRVIKVCKKGYGRMDGEWKCDASSDGCKCHKDGPDRCKCRVVYKGREGKVWERISQIECWDECPCSLETCPNREFQRGRKIPLIMMRHHVKNWTMRAATDIKKGDFIGDYTGEVLTYAEHMALKDEMYSLNYINCFYDGAKPRETGARAEETRLKLEDNFMIMKGTQKYAYCHRNFVITAKRKGNEGRTFSHSCKPNMQLKATYLERFGYGYHHWGFYAQEDIPKYTELTWNYCGPELEEKQAINRRRMKKKGSKGTKATMTSVVLPHGCCCGHPECVVVPMQEGGVKKPECPDESCSEDEGSVVSPSSSNSGKENIPPKKKGRGRKSRKKN